LARIFDGGIASPDKIAHRLVCLVRNPHCGQFAGPQQFGQVDGVAPVRLHPVAGLRRDQ
jgi:hypothetical protein